MIKKFVFLAFLCVVAAGLIATAIPLWDGGSPSTVITSSKLQSTQAKKTTSGPNIVLPVAKYPKKKTLQNNLKKPLFQVLILFK